MRPILLLLPFILSACAPESAQHQPKPPKPPEYVDVRVDRITANLPGIGARSWEAMEIVEECGGCDGGPLRFFDAQTRKAVVINDKRWVVLREFVRYDKRVKR